MGTNFHAHSNGRNTDRKLPENRSSRRSTTEADDAPAGVDVCQIRPATAGIKSSTGVVLGRHTHGHTATEERAAKQKPPVAPEGRGSDRGGLGFKFWNLKALTGNPERSHS